MSEGAIDIWMTEVDEVVDEVVDGVLLDSQLASFLVSTLRPLFLLRKVRRSISRESSASIIAAMLEMAMIVPLRWCGAGVELV